MRRSSTIDVRCFSIGGGVSHRRLLRKAGLSTFAPVKGNNKENKLLLIHNKAAKLENKKIKNYGGI